MLYVGEGPRGGNGACSTLCWISVTPSVTHNQIGPLWCWFPSGWTCARSRPPWVSPMTSTVRLRVSPAAAPTPMGVFNQRFEALFPCWSPGLRDLLRSPTVCPGLSMRNVGLRGATCRSPCPGLHHSESCPLGLSVCECKVAWSASGQTACPVRPTLHQSWSASPLHPSCLSSPLLPVWMNVSFLSTWCQTSLPFDFLLVLVVRGGTVCLPTPPSWFSHKQHFYEN